MRLFAEATALWLKNPLGPNVIDIHKKLCGEAVLRGELKILD